MVPGPDCEQSEGESGNCQKNWPLPDAARVRATPRQPTGEGAIICDTVFLLSCTSLRQFFARMLDVQLCTVLGEVFD